MAVNQAVRHGLGVRGEQLVRDMVGGTTTHFNAPFDVIDHKQKQAYEVKTMLASGKDMKIHISDNSMNRKKEFAEKHGYQATLVVVVYGALVTNIYSSGLRQSVRIAQMSPWVA